MAAKIKTYSFSDKNNATKRTEILIKQWYEKYGYLVFDVSDLKGYQVKDIDLLVYYNGDVNTQLKLEVKSDTYESNNYFAEVISNTSKNTLGCWLQTESDYIMYYFEKSCELHMIPTKQAQDYVINNYDKLKSVFVGTKTDNGKKILYYTEGKLVNKKQLQKAIDIEIYDLSDFVHKENVG